MVRSTDVGSERDATHASASRVGGLISPHLLGALVVAAVGFAAAGAAAVLASDTVQETDLARFERDRRDHVRTIRHELHTEAGILAAVRSFYGASVKVDGEEFAKFAGSQLGNRAGVEALEWVPRLGAEELRDYSAHCADYAVQNTTISERNAAGIVAVEPMARATRYPVFFEVTSPGSRSMSGLDRGADAELLGLMNAAARSGQPVATGVRGLGGAGSTEGSADDGRVLVFAPVYDNDAVIVSDADRETHLHGFAVLRLHPGRVLDDRLGPLTKAGISLAVRDLGSANSAPQPKPFYVSSGVPGDRLPDSERAAFGKAEDVAFADRTWQIVCRPTTAFFELDPSWLPIGTFVAGGLMTLLAAAYVRILLWQRRKITQVVEQRTSELAERNDELRREIDLRESIEEELKRSNAELAQFAYVASHDLQEPLRMVASYCQLLERKCGDAVGEKGKQYIHFAVDGAKRMQALISDLLEYSRINTRGAQTERVDLNDVAGQAVANLAAAIREAGATVDVGDLPVVDGVAAHLLQLFQNLIGNALKFRRDEAPRVEVACDVSGEQPVYRITDNGIGIAPEHQDRVFEVFKRLHAKSEFVGTGIGLAVCKKVVERHGGRIWIESEPGRGTTFLFTLSA